MYMYIFRVPTLVKHSLCVLCSKYLVVAWPMWYSFKRTGKISAILFVVLWTTKRILLLLLFYYCHHPWILFRRLPFQEASCSYHSLCSSWLGRFEPCQQPMVFLSVENEGLWQFWLQFCLLTLWFSSVFYYGHFFHVSL